MGRMVQYPRYNVVSFRLSDTEMKLFAEARGSKTKQDFLHGLLMGHILNKGGKTDGE